MHIRPPHQLAQTEAATVRQERTISKQLVLELRLSVLQKFQDSLGQGLSDPTMMEAAYDAILLSALTAFAAQGYRVSSNAGRQQLVLEGLAGCRCRAHATAVAHRADFLDSSRIMHLNQEQAWAD